MDISVWIMTILIVSLVLNLVLLGAAWYLLSIIESWFKFWK